MHALNKLYEAESAAPTKPPDHISPVLEPDLAALYAFRTIAMRRAFPQRIKIWTSIYTEAQCGGGLWSKAKPPNPTTARAPNQFAPPNTSECRPSIKNTRPQIRLMQ